MLIQVVLCCFFFFFFKQKTAYEMLRSLVGSEMCIRDRYWTMAMPIPEMPGGNKFGLGPLEAHQVCSAPDSHDIVLVNWVAGVTPGAAELSGACLLYTSDAADEEDSVDLGGRRIIKKKKKIIN
eukprot:TRINITY_DN14840_c0_g3_i3.p1 TRINITY_DN14840_c0_g3~~TRINITY_DN14840_c0_g3_i3.p1  ORF type:complete len:124 (+),score=54.75 TRINITY_DN14840_c0_g3_i3:79-450(+)